MEKVTNINKKLKMLRESFNYTQQEVAEKIGVGYSTYRKYETENKYPKVEHIINICNLYNISSDALLDLKIKDDK